MLLTQQIQHNYSAHIIVDTVMVNGNTREQPNQQGCPTRSEVAYKECLLDGELASHYSESLSIDHFCIFKTIVGAR